MMRTGRPRQFDRDDAVVKAMHLFWEHGYDSTSLAQLKASIGKGITAPSFYAAFGSKEALFAEAVSCYLQTHAQVTEALWDPDLPARQALETALRNSARMQYDPSHPRGCMVALSVMSSCSEENRHVLNPLEASRKRTRAGIRHCVERGIHSGELKDNEETLSLAVSFSSFMLGISTLARDNVPLVEVERGIAQMMRLWDAARA
ncbi:TetR/AcrR family transcriptional regulator [Candidatus Pantoea floridensis]|uniref:Transcriptional regulator, TetR family n=1 Tax=Candidatus Pantoea floridensis TaxID=1938870 RepID=A0A286DLP8_9GAMM|nr:TetR/AcrR family transcriptional regulator [Pantoea floridensis]PIF14787.1 TetR family transcriptional regulator [Enterobacteriaceae bacterium JKS000233]SOD59576.1 transcriptional regulator, TetR family [Pantoea floridensis]